ncbi:hypothetical protein [Lysobacter sp. A3-1-A15]|uniref:hypothetical protein n=1 Tax=Novilysobacter viscosus TaxID=3098602 RepID=UPI002EDA37F6
MNISARSLPFLLLLGVAAQAQAQDPNACPQLPVDSGLAWQHQNAGDSEFCRALRADGSEAFGMVIGRDSPFDPDRSNREETGRIDGREVQWYRAEIALKPGVQARETLVRLADGRVAHIWLQARSDDALVEAFGQAEALRFGARRDTQVVAGQ